MKIAALKPTHQHVYDNKKSKRIDIKNYFGLKVIINEIKLKFNIEVDIIDFKSVNDYDVILFSQHSYSDYLALIFTVEKKIKSKRNNIWIVGGPGVSNLNPLIEYFDYIIIGRGEELIIKLLKAIKNNKIIKNNSVVVSRTYNENKDYQIKYTKKLYPHKLENVQELMYGCKFNCFYCRYRYSSLPPDKRKEKTVNNMPGNEETFFNLNIDSGKFYTTSLDGLTEKIRYKANKKISNKMIVNKLVAAGNQNSIVNLKIYFIIGYPNETILNFDELKEVFEIIDSKINSCNMFINIHFTPFSAEPQTPLQWEKMNIKTDWRKLFDDMRKENKYLFIGKNVRVMFMRTTIKPLELLKRAIYNRAGIEDMKILKYIAAETEQITHNKNNTEKLNLLLNRFDITKFIEEKDIKTRLKTSNIKTWQSEENIIKQAYQFRKGV